MKRGFDWGKWRTAVLKQEGVEIRFYPERLTEAREARGMSKGELRLAARGVPVGSYESGKQVPDVRALGYLASALKVLPEFFMRPVNVEFGEPIHICGPEQCPCEALDCARWIVDGQEIEPCQYGQKRPSCEECERPFTHLCDGLARPDREGKDKRTCDVRMCVHHRHRVGPRADLCGKCYRRERRNKTA